MQQNYFVGERKTRAVEGEGAGTSGTWICTLDACGKSFHHTATADGKPFFQAVGGYDPHLKALKEVAFYADGSTATLVYRNPLSMMQGNLWASFSRAPWNESPRMANVRPLTSWSTLSSRTNLCERYTSRVTPGRSSPELSLNEERSSMRVGPYRERDADTYAWWWNGYRDGGKKSREHPGGSSNASRSRPRRLPKMRTYRCGRLPCIAGRYRVSRFLTLGRVLLTSPRALCRLLPCPASFGLPAAHLMVTRMCHLKHVLGMGAGGNQSVCFCGGFCSFCVEATRTA